MRSCSWDAGDSGCRDSCRLYRPDSRSEAHRRDEWCAPGPRPRLLEGGGGHADVWEVGCVTGLHEVTHLVGGTLSPGQVFVVAEDPAPPGQSRRTLDCLLGPESSWE